MHAETLESRRLLSAAGGAGFDFNLSQGAPVTAKLSRTGTLFVTGTAGRDTISITSSDAFTGEFFTRERKLKVIVTITTKSASGAVSVATATFPQSEVKRIDVQGGGGDDLLDVNTGITGRTVMHGGKGDDRLQTTGKLGSLFGDSGNDILTSNTSVSIFRFTPDDAAAPDGQRAVPLSFNLLNGGDGADVFRSRGGDDSIVGGAGADRFEPLEAGIAITNGLTLPNVNYVSGTRFGTSRVALSDVGVIAAEPADQDDVKVYLPSNT